MSAQSEDVIDASIRSRSPLRRLVLLFAAALTLGVATAALGQSHGHHGGGGRGEPRASAPRIGRGYGEARGPWEGRGGVEPPGRVYGSPGRGAYGPPGRTYAPPSAYPWGQPRPSVGWGGYPVYASPPGYPAPARPARGWRRGGYLPPTYPGAVVQDFPRYHLRRPPTGYSWVREGDEFLLVSSGTGLIFDVVPAY